MISCWLKLASAVRLVSQGQPATHHECHCDGELIIDQTVVFIDHQPAQQIVQAASAVRDDERPLVSTMCYLHKRLLPTLRSVHDSRAWNRHSDQCFPLTAGHHS